jgi:hypothetical protein
MLLAAKVKVAAPAKQKNCQASQHDKANQISPLIRLLYKKRLLSNDRSLCGF